MSADLEDLIEQTTPLSPSVHANVAGLAGQCPFCKGSASSLFVSIVNQFAHCKEYGFFGNAIDWVMKRDGVDLQEALRRLT